MPFVFAGLRHRSMVEQHFVYYGFHLVALHLRWANCMTFHCQVRYNKYSHWFPIAENTPNRTPKNKNIRKTLGSLACNMFARFDSNSLLFFICSIQKPCELLNWNCVCTCWDFHYNCSMDLDDSRIGFASAAAGTFVNGINVDRDPHSDHFADNSGSDFDSTASMVDWEPIHRSAIADRTVLVVVLFDTLSDCNYDHDTVVNPSAVNCLNLSYRMVLLMLACASLSDFDLVDHIHWTEWAHQVRSNDIDSILRDW